MKIARCTEGGAPFWALVDTDTQTLQPIAGAFADWGPALTRAIAAGKAEEGRAALPLAARARMTAEIDTRAVALALTAIGILTLLSCARLVLSPATRAPQGEPGRPDWVTA